MTAVWQAGQASPAAAVLLLSGPFAAAGTPTVASDSEATLDQKKVSGWEELPDLVVVSEQLRCCLSLSRHHQQRQHWR